MATKDETIKYDNVTYNTLHWWLRRKYGSAKLCENKDCLKTSKTFEWALLKNKEYEKKRENFIQLCRKCHFGYDLRHNQKEKFTLGRLKANRVRIGMKHSDESKEKISQSLKGRNAWNKGKKWSEESKLKMSLAHKGKIPWNKGKKI